MKKLKIFGNIQTFAISYRFNENGLTEDAKENLAYCHLLIDNKLIGYPDEVCYLKTWVHHLSKQKEVISKNRNNLFQKEFLGLNDREVFELILKSNQSEEDFSEEFLYLPKLDNLVWVNHSFILEETIDAFLFYFYVQKNEIIFLIEDRSKNQNRNTRTKNFIFSSVSLDEFLNTIDDTISFLVTKYPNLKDYI